MVHCILGCTSLVNGVSKSVDISCNSGDKLQIYLKTNRYNGVTEDYVSVGITSFSVCNGLAGNPTTSNPIV